MKKLILLALAMVVCNISISFAGDKAYEKDIQECVAIVNNLCQEKHGASWQLGGWCGFDAFIDNPTTGHISTNQSNNEEFFQFRKCMAKRGHILTIDKKK